MVLMVFFRVRFWLSLVCRKLMVIRLVKVCFWMRVVSFWLSLSWKFMLMM